MFSACSKRDGRMPAGGNPGARARDFWRRTLVRAIGLFAVLNLAMALPAQASTCAPAATRGTAPSDYQNYCGLDFTGYYDACTGVLLGAYRHTGNNLKIGGRDFSSIRSANFSGEQGPQARAAPRARSMRAIRRSSGHR